MGTFAGKRPQGILGLNPKGGEVEPVWSNGMATLYNADARKIPLADESVHCVVTSPP